MGKATKTYPEPKGTIRKVDLLTSTKEMALHGVNQLIPLLEKSADQSV